LIESVHRSTRTESGKRNVTMSIPSPALIGKLESIARA
jgi:hypothetical protein